MLSLCFAVSSNESNVAEPLNLFTGEMHKQGIFSGAVAVIDKGEHVFSSVVGYADADKSKSIEKDAVFNIGSISKEFTATSVLILADHNKIKLENHLSSYFPELPKWAEKVTIKHLLSHSAGLPAKAYQPGLTNAKIIAELQKMTALEFEPGSDVLYGSYGYQLLAIIVEKVSDQSFGHFVRDKIFLPLDMQHSYVFGTSPVKTTQIAMGYEFGRESVPQDFTTGAGNVFSNVSDLLKWERALFNNVLLKPVTLQQALEPFKCWGDDCRLNADFGIGVYLNGELFGIHHHGGFGGYQSMLYRFPQKNRAIVFTANNGLELQYNDVRFTLMSILDGKSPVFPKKDAHILYYDALINKSFADAKVLFIALRQQPDRYDVNEHDMNSIGYFLLGNNNAELAINTFKFSAEQFPDSANIWDSYGEALETTKNNNGARYAYEKALTLAMAAKNEKLVTSIRKSLMRLNSPDKTNKS